MRYVRFDVDSGKDVFPGDVLEQNNTFVGSIFAVDEIYPQNVL